MRKASVRDLHLRTSERRYEPVAEASPLSLNTRKIQFPDMSRIWNRLPQLAGDSTRFIEEDRDRCAH
jgi:hypothetical protein